MKPRIYIDTSVIGGCFDEEFKEFTSGLKFAVVSDLTLAELADAPEMVRKKLASIPETNYENIYLTEEAENLAEAYLNAGVVSPKYIVDAQHIAVATLNKVDSLVSWNFHHIVNLNRIRAFNAVNLRLGYHLLEIRSPREVLYEEEI